MSTPTFTYKEIDQEGLETLEVVGSAHAFNEWMFQTIFPYIQPGNVLEIGSGIGNISRFFLDKEVDITLTDIREQYCEALRGRFEGHPQLKGVFSLDLVHPQFEEFYRPYLGQFDNLYALNVIEHIEDDRLALANCKMLLKPGGRLIILVPAYQSLYNTFDRELYHFRRYTRKTMSKVFSDNNLKILRRFHFNCMGILGWFVSGGLLKKKTIPSGSMKLYDRLVPVFKIIDAAMLGQIGLSVIVVGEK